MKAGIGPQRIEKAVSLFEFLNLHLMKIYEFAFVFAH